MKNHCIGVTFASVTVIHSIARSFVSAQVFDAMRFKYFVDCFACLLPFGDGLPF